VAPSVGTMQAVGRPSIPVKSLKKHRNRNDDSVAMSQLARTVRRIECASSGEDL